MAVQARGEASASRQEAVAMGQRLLAKIEDAQVETRSFHEDTWKKIGRWIR